MHDKGEEPFSYITRLCHRRGMIRAASPNSAPFRTSKAWEGFLLYNPVTCVTPPSTKPPFTPSTAARKAAIAAFRVRPHIAAKHGPDARPARNRAEPTD